MTLLTANAAHSVHMCQLFWMSVQIFHTGAAQDVFFFCPPPLWSAVTQITVFSLSDTSPRCEVVWETWIPACKQWFLGQLEGHFTF